MPNKLDCYIALDWKGLTRTNTVAYLVGELEGKEKAYVTLTPGVVTNKIKIQHHALNIGSL